LGVDKIGGHAADPLTWNRYAYARDNPIQLVDANGLSWIEFNRSRKTLTLYSHEGKLIGTYPASNNPQGTARIDRLKNGRYPFQDQDVPHYHSTKTANGEDTVQGQFGIWGIFRILPYTDSYGLQPGVGVHAGRDGRVDRSPKKREGSDYPTNGCIRTCESAMEAIVSTALTDPLEYLDVTSDESSRKDASDKRVAAGLDDLGQNRTSWLGGAFDFSSVFGEGSSNSMGFFSTIPPQ
jgi:hypothetical protein